MRFSPQADWKMWLGREKKSHTQLQKATRDKISEFTNSAFFMYLKKKKKERKQFAHSTLRELHFIPQPALDWNWPAFINKSESLHHFLFYFFFPLQLCHFAYSVSSVMPCAVCLPCNIPVSIFRFPSNAFLYINIRARNGKVLMLQSKYLLVFDVERLTDA